MPKIPEDAELASWQRYFAMENNNRAWELSTKPRSAAEDLEMLHAAHAAARHWSSFGLELNDMRAKMLLAEVYALLGQGELALRLASEMREYFVGQETHDWELAFVFTIHAHAAWAAGEPAAHAESYAAAVEALATIADEENRKIVLETFEQVPVPSA